MKGAGLMKVWKMLLAISTALLLTGCSVNGLNGLMQLDVSKEVLLENLPRMDASATNCFRFSMAVTATDPNGMAKGYSLAGTLEICGSVSHMYGLDVRSGEGIIGNGIETWADFTAGVRYTDMGGSLIIGKTDGDTAIKNLADAINGGNGDLSFASGKSGYAVSWAFPIDGGHLFSPTLGDAAGISGSGRATAVFSPDTHEFSHFTFVISASDGGSIALLEAVFYWDIINGAGDALEIPLEVSSMAYEAATGVITDGTYDPDINPIAESFATSYGGTTEVTGYDGGSSMFWTGSSEGMSATVSYAKTADPDQLYDDSHAFLSLLYGEPAEETDDGTYFYSPGTGELVLITKGDGWYAEVIITAAPGTSQGELRKHLITYKSKLGI